MWYIFGLTTQEERILPVNIFVTWENILLFVHTTKPTNPTNERQAVAPPADSAVSALVRNFDRPIAPLCETFDLPPSTSSNFSLRQKHELPNVVEPPSPMSTTMTTTTREGNNWHHQGQLTLLRDRYGNFVYMKPTDNVSAAYHTYMYQSRPGRHLVPTFIAATSYGRQQVQLKYIPLTASNTKTYQQGAREFDLVPCCYRISRLLELSSGSSIHDTDTTRRPGALPVL